MGLSDLRTSRLYPFTLYCFLLEVLSALGSMKHPNNPIGNRTRDLLPSSAVPQPNAPLRTHMHTECAKNPCAHMKEWRCSVLEVGKSLKYVQTTSSGVRDLCHLALYRCNSELLVYYYAFIRYDFYPNPYPTSDRCTPNIRAPRYYTPHIRVCYFITTKL
jgi:hypothetical protein